MTDRTEAQSPRVLVSHDFNHAIREVADRLIARDESGRLVVTNRVAFETPSGAVVQRFSEIDSPHRDYPQFEAVTTDKLHVYRLKLAHSKFSEVFMMRKQGIGRPARNGINPVRTNLNSSAAFYREDNDEEPIVRYAFSDVDYRASAIELRDPEIGFTETLRLTTPDDSDAFERLFASTPGLVGELRLALSAVQRASMGPFRVTSGDASKVPHHDPTAPWQSDPHKS